MDATATSLIKHDTTAPRVQPWPALASTVLASATVFALSLFNFLRYNGYPVPTAEVGLLAAGLLLLISVVSLLHRRLSHVGKATLDGALVLFFVDQNGSWRVALAACLLTIAIVLWRKRSILPVLGVAAGFALMAGLVGIGAPPAGAASVERSRAPGAAPVGNAPPLLHIILDEHIGLAGLPATHPQAAATRTLLQDFYRERGFRLYPRAFSEHSLTVNSIPQIVNFGVTQLPVDAPKHGRQVAHNAYFDALAQAGYAVHVVQSKFLGLCRHPAVATCETYDQTRLAKMRASALSTADRAQVLGLRFLYLSRIGRVVAALYGVAATPIRQRGIAVPDFGLAHESRVWALHAVAAMDRLASEARRAQPGHAYVAHILLPHDAYALTDRCALKPFGQWLSRGSPAPQTTIEAAYLDQLRCATRKLGAVLDAFDQSSAGQQGIVIIHGDHGSRIAGELPTATNHGRVSREGLEAAFSTLFAARSPALAPGFDDAVAPVSRLLTGSVRPALNQPALSPRAPLTVDLADDAWIARETMRLPADWLRSSPSERRADPTSQTNP